MYLIFRNLIMHKLYDKIDLLTMKTVINTIDLVSQKYTINAQSTELAVIGRSEFMLIITLYFIIKQQEGMSKLSIKTEKYILDKFAMHCTVPLSKITSNTIRAYLYNYQLTYNVSQRTLLTYRTILCGFFKWCYSLGYIEKDITAVIHRFQYTKIPRKALTQLLLEEVRDACKSSLLTALIETLYSTGCRVSLIANIKQSDINWLKKLITVIGKGNKVRNVYINAKALKAIKNYLKDINNENGEWLFLNRRRTGKMTKLTAERIFRRIRDLLGYPKGTFVPHTMRHTMATQAATVCPIQQVQSMLGHASINTTMIYALINDEQVKAGHKLSVI